jgi:hypothetical protein
MEPPLAYPSRPTATAPWDMIDLAPRPAFLDAPDLPAPRSNLAGMNTHKTPRSFAPPRIRAAKGPENSGL